MMSIGVMFWKHNGGGAMMCLIARPRLSIMARLRFCLQSPVFASFVSRFGDGDFSCRHINIEFHVCRRGIASGDDLVAFVVDTDIQSVLLPLGCAQDQAKEALVAGDCAPCCGRNVLGVQLP